MDIGMDRVITIFATMPPLEQWAMTLVGAFLLLSWLYLLLVVRSLRRMLDDVVGDVRHTADRLSGTTLEQQGELIRRVGWAVTCLERIEGKLGSVAPPDMHVASITAENIVVRPSIGDDAGRHGGGDR
jgi:hypothetical protein